MYESVERSDIPSDIANTDADQVLAVVGTRHTGILGSALRQETTGGRGQEGKEIEHECLHGVPDPNEGRERLSYVQEREIHGWEDRRPGDPDIVWLPRTRSEVYGKGVRREYALR